MSIRTGGTWGVRILLADDHPLFADALRALIERNLAATTLTVVTDLDAAQRALAENAPYDLAIVDLHMPGANGFEGIERIRARFPKTPLAVISGAATPTEVSRALQLGAKGFLPKTLPSSVLAAALQVLAAGGTYVPTDYAGAAPQPVAATVASGLTPREAEVLALLAAGRANKEIGRALHLQEITVKLHVRNIFRKLGVRNRVEAANAAARLQLGGSGGRGSR